MRMAQGVLYKQAAPSVHSSCERQLACFVTSAAHVQCDAHIYMQESSQENLALELDLDFDQVCLCSA